MRPASSLCRLLLAVAALAASSGLSALPQTLRCLATRASPDRKIRCRRSFPHNLRSMLHSMPGMAKPDNSSTSTL